MASTKNAINGFLSRSKLSKAGTKTFTAKHYFETKNMKTRVKSFHVNKILFKIKNNFKIKFILFNLFLINKPFQNFIFYFYKTYTATCLFLCQCSHLRKNKFH